MPKFDIGNSDLKDLMNNQRYYVDKSVLIRDVLDGSKVTLLPRPRRFGKTLNMSMLRYFFEKTTESNAALFSNLKISADKEAMTHQGQHPVIYLSLKDIQGNNWDSAYLKLQETISQAVKYHSKALQTVDHTEKAYFAKLQNMQANEAEVEISLKKLVSALYASYGEAVVILIDEYDSPVIDAFQNDYYQKMITFMRSWLGAGLKHVDGLATFRAVITGILRVTRESIFSDLNNLKVCSILSPDCFADKFGFNEEEVKQILRDFDLMDKLPEIQQWYNGYKFGGTKMIYNPWSVVSFIDSSPAPIGPQWLNTSSNALVHQELAGGGLRLKSDLEKLLSGGEFFHDTPY